MSERIKALADEFTEEIVCPHCGFENHDSWEHSSGEADK